MKTHNRKPKQRIFAGCAGALIAVGTFLLSGLAATANSDCVIPTPDQQPFSPPIRIQLPDGTNGVSMDPAASNTFARITLANVPDGYSVENITYDAWCVDAPGPLCPREAPGGQCLFTIYKPILYSSCDLAALGAANLPTTNWNQVNWIINNVDFLLPSFNVSEIQAAIWRFVGFDQAEEDGILLTPPGSTYEFLGFPGGTVANVDTLVMVANGAGSTFVPGPGDLTAIVLDLPANLQDDEAAPFARQRGQLNIIAVPCPTGEIGDTVFCDLDGDGEQELPLEFGLPNVKVDLRCELADGRVVTGSQRTDADGKYLFTDLPPGVCTVTVDPSTAPPNCNIVPPPDVCPPEYVVNLDPGESFLDADFCFFPPPPPLGKIGDTVWCDFNRDGVQDVPDEPGIPDVTVYLFCAPNTGSGFMRMMMTDSNGNYCFEDLPPGSCWVWIDVSTAPPECNEVIDKCPIWEFVNLGPGEIFLDADFCLAPPTPVLGQIGDTVFCDENENGVQDNNEPGLPGVTVNLVCFLDAGGTITRSQETGADGKYLFTGLPPGSCTVTVDPNTAPPDCNRIVECPPIQTVDLGPGQIYLDADFCFSPPLDGEIGDTVFCDEDGDGFQGPGEDGLPGVTVDLKCTLPDGTMITDSQMTGADGKYLFTNLPESMCVVTVDPSTAPPDCNVIPPPDVCPPEYFVNLGPGEKFLDADFCFFPCPLQLEAFCKLPPPPGTGDDCDGSKVTGITMLYTAEGCSATSSSQDSGKVKCEGITGPLPGTVYIVAAKEDEALKAREKAFDGDDEIWFFGTVSEGNTYDILASTGNKDELASATFVHIFSSASGPVLRSTEFHTSCSQPLALGNQFAANLVVGLSFKDGRTLALPDPVDDLQKNCEIVLSGGELCEEGKVISLDLIYTAEPCGDFPNPQDGKAKCEDFGPLPDDVYIIVTNEDKANEAADGKGKTWFKGDVSKDGVFTASAANAGEDKFDSSSYVHVYASQGGALLQTVEFHTSCSQALNAGDEFGSILVFGGVNDTTGPASLGAQVTFVYQVKNIGSSAINNVVVTDSIPGDVPGSPIPTIPAGETVVLERSVSTTGDISNVVRAVLPGSDCEDSDNVTVDVVPPPPGPIECTTKIQAMLLTYIGPDIPGNVTVVFNPDKGPDVTYSFPGGLLNGTTLSKPGQNDFTIDATVGGEEELGSKTIITFNGVDPDSGIHTSCSANFFAQQPAPLNDPKGDPSPNWFVEFFTQKP